MLLEGEASAAAISCETFSARQIIARQVQPLLLLADPRVRQPMRCDQVEHYTQTCEGTATRRKTRVHTETQTHTWASTGAQVKREAAVQMQKHGLYISDIEDKVLEPTGVYEDADAVEEMKNRKSIIIQASVRRFLAQKRALGLRSVKREREEHVKAAETQAKRKRELFDWREENRCLRPETYEDFRSLYAGLEIWRRHEAERIKQIFTNKDHRQQAFKELLQKETDVLQHIENLKLKAKKENKEEKIRHMLDLLAQPLEWLSSSSGEITTVHTPETSRAGELRDLYIKLGKDDLPPKKRLAALWHIRRRVEEAAIDPALFSLVSEFNELVQREIDYLQRGRTNSDKLSGLRQRLTHAFWALIQTPQFNPQAGRFFKPHSTNLLTC